MLRGVSSSLCLNIGKDRPYQERPEVFKSRQNFTVKPGDSGRSCQISSTERRTQPISHRSGPLVRHPSSDVTCTSRRAAGGADTRPIHPPAHSPQPHLGSYQTSCVNLQVDKDNTLRFCVRFHPVVQTHNSSLSRSQHFIPLSHRAFTNYLLKTMSPLNPTATPFLPAISSLPTLPDTTLTSTLDLLFEPTSELHSLALPTIRTCSFASYDELIDTLRGQLLTIASQVQDNSEGKKKLHHVLGSHPRLGAPKVKQEDEELSEQSKNEQKQLRGGDENEARRLAELNEEYEKAFPGLRQCVILQRIG